MTTKINLTYFGMDGTGRTVTEAKQDAGAKIERALSGSYTPEVFAHRGHAVLVYREPSGWHTALVNEPDGPRTGILCSCEYGDRTECVTRALAHLAQLGWQETDGETPPVFLTDRREVADFRSWAQFQLRACHGKRIGIRREDLHDYASQNPWRADLWLHEGTTVQVA